MHDHDPDLVAALAEGSLGKAEARAAEADLQACPRCAADLSAQRRSLQATSVLQGATLTDSERTDLRSAIAAAINLEIADAPEPTPVRGRRRTIPWPSIAVAALSVVAVVAIVPLIGTLSTSGSDDAATAAEFDLTSTTGDSQRLETAAAPTADDGGIGQDGVSNSGMANDAPTESESLGIAEGGTLGATGTTGAPATTMAPPPQASRLGDADLKALAETAPDVIARSSDAPDQICADVAADWFESSTEVRSAALTVGENAQLEAVVYFSTTDGESFDRLVILDAATCEVVGQLG